MAMQGLSMHHNSMTELINRNLASPVSSTFANIGTMLQRLSQSSAPQQLFNNAMLMHMANMKTSPDSADETTTTTTIPEDFVDQLQAAIRQTVSTEVSQKILNGHLGQIKGSLVVSIANQDITLNFEQEPLKTPQRSASSKRKKSNPIRLVVPESGEELSPPKTTSPVSTAFQPVRPTEHHSHPSSPSADSGVLDLSRANSHAGSAPITPLKSDEMPRQLPLFDYLQNLQNSNNFASNFMANNLFSKLPFPQTSAENDFKFMTGLNSSFNCAPFVPTCKVSPSHSPVKLPKKRVSNGPRLMRQGSSLRRSNGFARKFPCNQCNEEFPSLHTLENHTMSVHKGYRCHICQAQFTQRSNLQRHALKHVGFKPFECRVCKKAYYRKDHLIRHMEMGHPGCNPRDNITVHLTSSESLDFLNKLGEEKMGGGVRPEGMFIDPQIKALLEDATFSEMGQTPVKVEPCCPKEELDETDGPKPRVSDSTVSISHDMMEMDLDQSASSVEEEGKLQISWNAQVTGESS
ncbi:hypothetical protein Ciccas_011386 [Cichlidogyrus casuarinus]|uniref:C2H2-type domain-containing protein n=1 Tax=Cichlidogyrus casuarinus TaxID=1844966 RepID=A0ABD2PRF9_9PLAT